MLRNYLTIALRNLLKNRGYTIINLVGLAVGLAGILLIVLYINHELTFDRHHTKARRIVRVLETDPNLGIAASVPFPVGPTLQLDYPEQVEATVRLYNFQSATLPLQYEDPVGNRRQFNESAFFFADSTFFRVFDAQFLKGNPQTALDDPYSVVMTQSAAQRYFGPADPMGKVLQFEKLHDLHVTAVVADPPPASHFHYELLASFAALRTIMPKGIPDEDWYTNPVWTYALLRDAADTATLQAQLPQFAQRHLHPALKETARFQLEPLTDIHLHSLAEGNIEPNSNIRLIWIVGTVAVFLLLIAGINFINLSTARAFDRAKEVGIRKVAGAHPGQLIAQFLAESIILCLMAAALAVFLAWLALPVLNNLTDRHLSLQHQSGVWVLFLAATLLIGIAAGSYPAFVLSSFRPVEVLKGRTGGRPTGNAWLRQSLVVVQFFISIALIGATITAYRQLRYIQKARLGFEAEQVVVLPVERTSLVSKYDAFKQQLLTHSAIRAVTGVNEIPGTGTPNSTYRPVGGSDDDMKLYSVMYVRDDLTKTLGIPLLAGNDFPSTYESENIIALINRAMMQEMGWATPEEAIGQHIEGTLEGRIRVVGVVDDFHYGSLHYKVGPLLIDYCSLEKLKNYFTHYVLVRVQTDDLPGVIRDIGATWQQFTDQDAFDYYFLNDELQQLYHSEQNFSKLAGIFATLAALIASLGLLGLTAFSIQKRKREIGIRKVLGASESQIVLLLGKNFTLLIGIALVLAIPVVYLGMSRWLEDFAYHISLRADIFLLAGLAALLLAWFTVSWLTVRAAWTNPVDTLRAD
ncbi:putative ABC transport system permease protein [Catalinimonas alkaloidigena]|uniref:Putative ABC transport system permease protein n=1 Tax=Catalinimonas alkaloidigena TaxID=1075417 RepID=A0A1G9AD01_9BACT|nr:FtsX-like permease family protein [Catalinimonas alkaloidigena]SDK25121.1 putative ABC transport system permease protein [Catalinimonas alkaloidigena]